MDILVLCLFGLLRITTSNHRHPLSRDIFALRKDVLNCPDVLPAAVPFPKVNLGLAGLVLSFETAQYKSGGIRVFVIQVSFKFSPEDFVRYVPTRLSEERFD